MWFSIQCVHFLNFHFCFWRLCGSVGWSGCVITMLWECGSCSLCTCHFEYILLRNISPFLSSAYYPLRQKVTRKPSQLSLNIYISLKCKSVLFFFYFKWSLTFCFNAMDFPYRTKMRKHLCSAAFVSWSVHSYHRRMLAYMVGEPILF